MTAAPKPLVYVAGPITGNPFGCVRQAAEAFDVLRAAGCVPFLPQLSVIHEMVAPRARDEWLAYDHDVIRRCDALVRLPGDSPGADSEVTLALELGLPVFRADVPRHIEILQRWVPHWTREHTPAIKEAQKARVAARRHLESLTPAQRERMAQRFAPTTEVPPCTDEA